MTDDVIVRATITLRGLRAGHVTMIRPEDLDDPYVRKCIAARFVVRVDEEGHDHPDTLVDYEPPNKEMSVMAPEPKFGEHVLYNGEKGANQFGHITDVRPSGNVDILYKEDGGGLELASDVPYRGADDRKKDGGGHTYHRHGD